jgi:C-8 sterol isomerase
MNVISHSRGKSNMNAPFIETHLQPKKKYLFDPRVLNDIRNRCIGRPLEESFEYIINELDRHYPGHICKKPVWIFNNAGGAMGQLALLHASLREYIILFGTCVGTEGHSGRYASEVYDYVIRGEMICEYEGRFTREEFTPDTPGPAYLGKKVIKHYRIPEEAWMIEYCRGNVPKMFPFGTFDSIFSTIDVRTIARLIITYATLTLKGLFTKGKDITALLKLLVYAGIGAFCVLSIARFLQS